MLCCAVAILSSAVPLAAASLTAEGLWAPLPAAIALFLCLSAALLLRIRSLQSRLRVLQEELEREKRLCSDRLHLASHKLIGITNVITGFLSLLRTERGEAISETETRYMDEIEKGATRGLEIAMGLAKEEQEGQVPCRTQPTP